MNVLHTALWVDDLETAESFYLDVLGFEPDWERDGDGGVRNVFVSDEGESGLQFKTKTESGTSQRLRFDHVAIGVEDVDSMVDRLTTVGGTVLREPFSGEDDRRRAFIRDPFGHQIELIEDDA